VKVPEDGVSRNIREQYSNIFLCIRCAFVCVKNGFVKYRRWRLENLYAIQLEYKTHPSVFRAISYIDGPMYLVTSTLQMEAVFFSKTFPTTHKSRLCHCVEGHVLSCEILRFYENKLALLYLTVGLKTGVISGMYRQEVSLISFPVTQKQRKPVDF
jgi:hypothetical protein